MGRKSRLEQAERAIAHSIGVPVTFDRERDRGVLTVHSGNRSCQVRVSGDGSVSVKGDTGPSGIGAAVRRTLKKNGYALNERRLSTKTLLLMMDEEQRQRVEESTGLRLDGAEALGRMRVVSPTGDSIPFAEYVRRVVADSISQ